MSDTAPNILWICTDQQRFDAIGPTTDDQLETSTLADLAAEGVRFDRAYCQSPVCMPSRGSFLTGRYPRTTRCRQNGQPLPETERLVTARLAEAGYRCGLVGKLHLSPTNVDDSASSLRREPVRRPDDGYGTFRWSPSPWNDSPANEYRQWLRSVDSSFERTPYCGSEYVETSVPPEYHQTTWLTDRAIDYVERAAESERPWLLSLNYFDPHHPFDPPREYLERYVDSLNDIQLPEYAPDELEHKPQVQREAAADGRFVHDEMAPEDHRLVRAAYYAMVELIDDQLSRLLDALASTDQRETTLVVFMSDHGEMLGDHGIYKKGPYFYEPAVRVPLIVSMPGTVREGLVRDDLVELTDVAPTLLEAAGVPTPAGVQGRSVWPIATRDGTDFHRESAYCEFYNASRRHTDPPAYATMVRTDEYKLVAHHGTDDGELYDLASDLAERENRWDDPDYADVQRDLLERLTDRMARTTDPLPERIGSW